MDGVREIRRTVLPQDVFELVEGYMLGTIKTLHMIAVTKNGQIIRVSAGSIPDYIAANDSSAAEIAKFLP